MTDIVENLELLVRDANWMLERVDRADLNVSDNRRIVALLQKSRKLLSDANSIM